MADKYPVAEGHALVIPRRHVQDYFDLGRPELNCVHFLLEAVRREILATDLSVRGFNVGVNCGPTATPT